VRKGCTRTATSVLCFVRERRLSYAILGKVLTGLHTAKYHAYNTSIHFFINTLQYNIPDDFDFPWRVLRQHVHVGKLHLRILL
jgi:hypothetical protein